MAVPRVFISSTYYDLKQARNNIGDFVKSLGYEPVMNERSGVAYTQTEPLEIDCYHELASCDIVVCIIGNHFGSKSSVNDFSITMNEINTAIKNKKKVYIFIANDVFIENRTYEQNKDTGTFKSAYTDDIKIHEYISELKNNNKIHVIESFETTEQIIRNLKLQFAGLFQNLLAREASMTEAKTAYDLQETADGIKNLIEQFDKQKEEFFAHFDSTIIANNLTLTTLKKYLGFEKAAFFAPDYDALSEILKIAGYNEELGEERNEIYKHTKTEYHSHSKTIKTIILKDGLFDEDLNLLKLRKKADVDANLIYAEVEEDTSDDELPF